MLQVNNVNLEVGNAVLLHNINITLELGKIYGVLGSNGAGKTTMFKSMLGLTDFTGEILSDNQPVSSRLFGSLIEYPAFYPKLTAEENLRLHAKYLQINNPDIRTALEQVNLWEARNKLFATFPWYASTAGHCTGFFGERNVFVAGRTNKWA